MGDFEQIREAAALAIGNVGDELTFPFSKTLEVIALCSANEIAVLGVELFLVRPDGHYASGFSVYELQEKQLWPTVRLADWPHYVSYNNALAEEWIRQDPPGPDYVYIFTTSSWREFQEIQAIKDSWGAL